MHELRSVFSIIGFFLLFSCEVYADRPSERLIQALERHESNNNDYAIGDKKDLKGRPRPPSEWAYGRLQIRQVCCNHVNEYYGTRYKAKDCLGNPKLSREICVKYIDMLATANRLGRKPTEEDMARIWNGGPAGWKSRMTVRYWRSISGRIKK